MTTCRGLSADQLMAAGELWESSRRRRSAHPVVPSRRRCTPQVRRSPDHRTRTCGTRHAPAWVDARRKVGEKRVIENPMGKCTVQLRGVDAHYSGRESIAHESPGKLGGVEPPDRKDWLKAR